MYKILYIRISKKINKNNDLQVFFICSFLGLIKSIEKTPKTTTKNDRDPLRGCVVLRTTKGYKTPLNRSYCLWQSTLKEFFKGSPGGAWCLPGLFKPPFLKALPSLSAKESELRIRKPYKSFIWF
jgi:hypothetical protein